jgi:hypothetical protein
MTTVALVTALPLRGLASDAAYIRSFLASIPGPIVLVVESGPARRLWLAPQHEWTRQPCAPELALLVASAQPRPCVVTIAHSDVGRTSAETAPKVPP